MCFKIEMLWSFWVWPLRLRTRDDIDNFLFRGRWSISSPQYFFHKKRSDMLPVKQEHVFNVQLKRCKSIRKRYWQCLLDSKFHLGINLIRVTTYPCLSRMQMYFNKQIINNSKNNKNRNNIKNIKKINLLKKISYIKKYINIFLWRNSLFITIIQCIRRSIRKDFFGISLTYLIEEKLF
jgi:hypothetical protein